MEKLNIAESLLFERFAGSVQPADVPLVFILGSPRTGSTLAYQLLVNFFGFFYFSNFVADYYPEYPSVGSALDHAINPRTLVTYESAYGKTSGVWEPSEASSIFRNWFGGEHPSQTKSCDVFPAKELHLVNSMKSIYALTSNSILIKNAWNCFRIATIMRLFPRAQFVWIRRDIGLSALSDLASRYRRGGPTVWNSATTANYLEIQELSYWQQVVEQQFEYNKTIKSDLQNFCQGHFIEIWYEEMCNNLEIQIEKINRHFSNFKLPVTLNSVPFPKTRSSSGDVNGNLKDDYARIMCYIMEHEERLHDYIFS